MIRISYTIKNIDGLLVDKTQVFNTLSELTMFIAHLRASGQLVGKPTIS
jgi:hypothetical protein